MQKWWVIVCVVCACGFVGATQGQASPGTTTQPSSGSSGLCTATPGTASHVQWAKMSFAQSLQKAQKTGCPILVDMYATWCQPCKRYDREVFNRTEVAEFVHQHFIPLRRDGMIGEGKLLAKQYNCVTYPCILVIGQKGREIERITKFLKAPLFMSRLEQIKIGQDTLASLMPQLKKNPNDAVLRYRIGRRLAYRGDARCIEHLQFVANHPPARYPWLAGDALYVLGRIYYRNTKRDCVGTLKVLRTYLARYPNGPKVRQSRRLISWCLRRMQR